MGPLNFDVELLHKALDGVMSKKDVCGFHLFPSVSLPRLINLYLAPLSQTGTIDRSLDSSSARVFGAPKSGVCS